MMRRASPQPVQRTPLPADLWVLIAAALCVAIGFGLVSPVLPQFAHSFDVSATAVSMVISIFAMFRLVFAPAGGVLIDKLGERWVYMLGLVIVALSTLAVGFAQDYWQLLVFRGLGGVGSTMFTISAGALLVRLAPPQARGRVSSYYASTFLLGNILGPILGGLLVSFGMRMPFFIYAAALLIATAVAAMFLREGRRRGPETEAAPPMQLGAAMSQWRYRGALLGAFATGWTNFGMRVAIVPLFAAQAFEHGARSAAYSLTGFALGTAAMVFVAGHLADTLGRKPLIVAGLIVSGGATVFLGTMDHLAVFIALSAVAGIGAGMLNPAEQAVVADVIGKDRSGGKVMATFQMSQDLGAISGPIAAGIIVDTVGFTWAFALSGGLCVLVGLVWMFLPESHPDTRIDHDVAATTWDADGMAGEPKRQGVDSDL